MNSNRQAIIVVALSLSCVLSVARVRDLRVLRVCVYFTGSFASRQFYRLLTVSGKFIKGELFGLLNQCTSDFCSFNIGHLKLPFKIPCSSSAKLIFIPSSEFKKLFLQK